MDDDFYEEDEPLEKVRRAFERGDRGLTAAQDLVITFKGNVIKRVKAGESLGINFADYEGAPVVISGNRIE